MSIHAMPSRQPILRIAAEAMPPSPMAVALVKAGLVAIVPPPGHPTAAMTVLPVEELAGRHAVTSQHLDQLRREIAASATHRRAILAEYDRLRAALTERQSLVVRARRQVAAARQTAGAAITAEQRALARALLAEAVGLLAHAIAARATVQQSLDGLLSTPDAAAALAARQARQQRHAERALCGIWPLARRQPARALARLHGLNQAELAPATRRAIRAALAVADRASARQATSS